MWAFINDPPDRAGLGFFNKDQMKVKADCSVDLYVGPNTPTGETLNLPMSPQLAEVFRVLGAPD
jgi:hypothetical protein